MIGIGEIITAMARGRMLPMTSFTGVSRDKHHDEDDDRRAAGAGGEELARTLAHRL